MASAFAAGAILAWFFALIMPLAWGIGLATGGKVMSWKRLAAIVITLGITGWIFLMCAASIAANC